MVKGVRSYLYNIILVILLVLISIPVWFNKKNDNAYSLAASFNDISIYLNVDKIHYYSLDSVIVKNFDVIIRNQNDFDKSYDLVLKLENNPEIDYSNIIVEVNDEKMPLTSYNYKLVNDYYLINIDNNNINRYTTKNYEVKLNYSDFKVSNLYAKFMIK